LNTANLSISHMLISFLLMAIILLIDLQLPLGVAGGVPYVTVVLASLWFQNKGYVIASAIICTILTLIGLYFSPEGGEIWKVITNRVLAIFAIWVTAILAINWEITRKKILLIEHKTEKENEKKEIYKATMHGALHITNNLLNQLKLVEMEIENHKNFDKEILIMFNGMLLEASDLLTKLSSVEDIEAEKIIQSVYPE